MWTKVLVAVSLSLGVLTFPAQAQQPKKVPRIGYLVLGFPPPPSAPVSPYIEAFYRGLRDQGYTEGKNLIVEYRYARGKSDRLPKLAAEFVSSKADVIIATSSPAIRAARAATIQVPIVIISVTDPVTDRLVDSLARPGGNITGVSSLRPTLSGKQLELLVDTVPGITPVGVLRSPASMRLWLTETENAAQALKVQLRILEVQNREELERTFLVARKDRLRRLILLPSILLSRNRTQIAELAIKSRLPAIFWQREFAEAGGFMAYGPSGTERFRRAGVLAGKILRGSRPADLPVEQSMNFELIFNLKTAKQIGVTIPPNVLARADRVIK
jgi:putative ABC transport system substrate-binding protein